MGRIAKAINRGLKQQRVLTQKMTKAVLAHGERIGGPCTFCGAKDHWRPDCPKIAKMMRDPKFKREMLLTRFTELLTYARSLGFNAQLEVSRPAPKFQPIAANDIYLRPMDGSDMFHCVCCARPYEAHDRDFRGIIRTPIGWCDTCFELLQSKPYGEVLEQFRLFRIGKLKLIQKSMIRIRKLIKGQNTK